MAQGNAVANAAAPTASAPRSTARTTTAAQRVLATPELVDLIVEQVLLEPRMRLPELNRAFRASCSRPQVWAARTAPSTIDWTHHVVHTERCMTLHKAAVEKRPITWHHAGEEWRLHCTRREPKAGDEGALDWVWGESRRRMRPFLVAHPLSQSLWCTPNGRPLYLENVQVRQCVTLSFLEQRWERKQAQVCLLEPPLCAWWELSEVANKLSGTFVLPSFLAGFLVEHSRREVSRHWIALEALFCWMWLIFGLRDVREEYRRYRFAQGHLEELTETLGCMPQVSAASYLLPSFAFHAALPSEESDADDAR